MTKDQDCDKLIKTSELVLKSPIPLRIHLYVIEVVTPPCFGILRAQDKIATAQHGVLFGDALHLLLLALEHGSDALLDRSTDALVVPDPIVIADDLAEVQKGNRGD